MTGITSIVRRFGRGRIASAVGILSTLVISGSAAAAAARTPYALNVEGERTGERVLISMKITKTPPDGEAETVAAPRLQIQEGRRGLIVVGSEAPAKAPPLPGAQPNPVTPAPDGAKTPAAQPPAGEDDLESGLRVDVITVKGDDEVLVLATMVEDGVTVWADVQKVKLRARPEAK